MPITEFQVDERRNAETLIELAMAEDLGTAMPGFHLDRASGRIAFDLSEASSNGRDVTTESTLPQNARGSARFVARTTGVVSGLPVLGMIADRFGVRWCYPKVEDGQRVEPGTLIAVIMGPMYRLLLMERTALNFLQHLSGIATLTSRHVSATAGTKATILDTRKTTPGWRSLEKYAVRCGGGTNHRMGLFDAVLIKDNHIAWLAFDEGCEPVSAAIRSARAKAPAGMIVEVEVDSLEQFDIALENQPDIILVDNLGSELLAEAVRRRNARAPGVLLEASGGVSLETVTALAATGVDRISVGALTHSAPALDIGLDFNLSGPS